MTTSSDSWVLVSCHARLSRRLTCAWLVLPLVFAFVSCRASKGPGRRAPRPLEDPTFGICKPLGAEADLHPIPTALAEARQALERGCPREALQVLGRAASQSDLSARERAGLALAGLTAVQAAIGRGVSANARVGTWKNFQHEEWLRLREETAGQLLQRVLNGAGNGLIPADQVEKLALGNVLVRAAPPGVCTPTLHEGMQRKLEEETARSRQLRAQALAQLGFSSREPGALELLARNALWDCALEESAHLYEEAGTGYRAAGKLDEELRVQLRALEVQYFPGGRADDLALMVPTPADQAALAAEEESAQAGIGPGHKSGIVLDARLRRLGEKAHGDANRARVAWLRAVAALRLRQRPEEAVKLARAAIGHAAKARRADLVDAARVVLAFALADAGRWRSVKVQMSDLVNSAKRRGTPGLLAFVLARVQMRSGVLTARGLLGQALALVRAAGVLAPHVGPYDEVGYLGTLARSFGNAARFDEALAVAERAVARARKRKDELAAVSGEESAQFMIDSMETNRDQLLLLMGREPPRRDEDAFVLGDPYLLLRELVRRGNKGGFRTFLERQGGGKLGSALEAWLIELGYCRAAEPRLVEEALRTEARTADLDLFDQVGPLMYGRESTTDEKFMAMAAGTRMIFEFAGSLISCGAELRSPELVRIGRRLLARSAMLLDRPTDFAAEQAEAEQRYEEAARRYLERVRRTLDIRSLDAGSGVNAFSITSSDYFRAAASLLRQRRPDVAKALATLEEARARDLRVRRAASTARGQTKQLTELEREISELEARLRALRDLEERTSDHATKKALASTQRQASDNLKSAQKRRDAEVRRLERRDRRAYRTAALAPPLSLAEIQARLRQDEMLVYYATQVDEAYAIVVGRRVARAIELPATDADGIPELALALNRRAQLALARQRQVRSLVADSNRKRPVSEPSAADPQELADTHAELYRILVEPLLPYIPKKRRVIIVPDGATADLPFAVLGPRGSPWIVRNPLRLLPGAHLLPAPDEAARKSRRAGAVVVLGDPTFGRGVPELPGSRDEAVAIAGLYGVKPLLGSHATEQALRSKAKNARILHLATHGVPNATRPSYAYLLLARSKETKGTDGALHAFEIDSLQLHAELVVLSACETGVGQLRGEEGILALDRAFLVAGVDAVVSSLWSVSDQSTVALMKAFHEELRRNHPADVALRSAMLRIRKNPRWADPYHWGAFRVVGAGLR